MLAEAYAMDILIITRSSLYMYTIINMYNYNNN